MTMSTVQSDSLRIQRASPPGEGQFLFPLDFFVFAGAHYHTPPAGQRSSVRHSWVPVPRKFTSQGEAEKSAPALESL